MIPPNVSTIDDAAAQSHISYSMFIGVCVAASLFFIPSIIGGHVLPPGGPVGAMQTTVAVVLGVTASCHTYYHLGPTELK